MFKFFVIPLLISACNCFVFHGATQPLGLFDPFKFMEKSQPEDLCRFREAELKHSRWAMIGTVTIPLIETQTNQPAIHQFQQLSTNVQILLVTLIAMGEVNTILKGYVNPFSLKDTDKYFNMRSDYQPGDFGFKVAVFEDEPFYNKELNNGRLAMIAFMGMMVQELVTEKPQFIDYNIHF